GFALGLAIRLRVFGAGRALDTSGGKEQWIFLSPGWRGKTDDGGIAGYVLRRPAHNDSFGNGCGQNPGGGRCGARILVHSLAQRRFTGGRLEGSGDAVISGENGSDRSLPNGRFGSIADQGIARGCHTSPAVHFGTVAQGEIARGQPVDG